MISNSFSWQRKKEIQGFEFKKEKYKRDVEKEGKEDKLLKFRQNKITQS